MPAFLLRNAEVFAPEPLGVCSVLVAGGRVAWIGAGTPKLPAELGVEEVDFAGRRLIPGLVDLHVHVTGGGGEAGPETRVPPVPVSRFTTGGVTTVVGLLGTDDVTRDIAGLVATARGLANEGITAYCWTGGYHLPPVTATGSVRRDMALIAEVVGVGEVAVSDHRSSQPTLDDLLKVAGDAHVGGLMTGKAGVVHLHMGDGPRGLDLVRRALDVGEIPPRVFNPTHVNRKRALFDEALALAQRGCTVDITAFPVAEGDDAIGAGDALRRFLDAGLPEDRVTVSSDAGGCLPAFDADGRVARFDVGDPGALIGTLRALVTGGQALERVLPAFTANPARLLRLARKGRIAADADADLVVLDAKGGITDVMAMGRWMVREGRVLVRGTFEDGGQGSGVGGRGEAA
jgi:beta-aspartyl-dipeptidase (metallo-type)